jgi:hypothetical protein
LHKPQQHKTIVTNLLHRFLKGTIPTSAWRLSKITKNLSNDSLSPDRDLNAGPPEYESGVLTTQSRCSVTNNIRKMLLRIQNYEHGKDRKVLGYVWQFSDDGNLCYTQGKVA